MPIIEDGTKNTRKIHPIIYVIDTSGSMAGIRIEAVNQSMAETIEVLKEVSAKNPTAEIKIGVLQFASGASWVTNKDELVFMDDFFWNDLTAGGITDLGAALNELHKSLSRSALLKSDVGFKVPVLIFMSDGGPTDDYRSALKKISDNNKWFTVSKKICIAIDEDSDVQVLEEIAGCGDKVKSSESVIQVSDVETLKKLIILSNYPEDNPYYGHKDWLREVSWKTELAQKIIPIIYVIDTSGDMVRSHMATLNQAMSETIEVLKEVSAKNPTAELKIGVLQYGNGARWVTGEKELVAIDDFYWNDLTTGGTTDLGAALKELHKKMSSSAFFNSEFDYSVPFLLFMSDGGPTDDYKSALKKISDNNKWFTASTKIYLAIDTDSDVEVFQEIAGCGDKAKGSESVIQVSDMETLKMLIKIFSVIAIKTGAASIIDFDYNYERIEAINGYILAPDEVILSENLLGGPGEGITWDDWG